MANKYLIELLEKNSIKTEEDEVRNIMLWNDLLDKKDPMSWSDDIVKLESNYLKTELIKFKPVNIFNLDSIIESKDFEDKIIFYDGNISSLFIDALAVPMLGIKRKNEDKPHCVYYLNGINLRRKINSSIGEAKAEESEVFITRSYNLPCDFILHVNYDYKDIKKAVINIMECARVNMIKSLLIDIDSDDLKDYKDTYDAICDYLDKFGIMFDKILIYVNKDVDQVKLKKEL